MEKQLTFDKNNFLKRLKSDLGIINEDCTVIEPIIVDKSNYQLDLFVLENIDFQSGLAISTIELSRMKLTHCKGSRLLLLSCSIASSPYDIYSENEHINDLILENCSFDEVTILECTLGSMTVKSSCSFDSLSIQKTVITQGSVTLSEVKVKNSMGLKEIQINNGFLDIKNSEIASDLIIDDLSTRSILLGASRLHKSFKIINSQASIISLDTIFEGRVRFEELECEKFTSSNDRFNDCIELTFQTELVRKVHIMNTYIEDFLSFSGKGNTQIEDLMIASNNHLNGYLSFLEFKTVGLSLLGTNYNANIAFKNCGFSGLRIQDFYNQKGLSFNFCIGSTNSILDVKDSDLGRASFLNMDFSSFNRISIVNSTISSCSFISCRMFSLHQFGKILSKNRKNEEVSIGAVKATREVYKQVRKAHLSESDVIPTIEMKSIELMLYRKEITLERPWYDKDRIMLALSSTNDMGSNWVKPICYLFCITVFFYLVLVAIYSPNMVLISPLEFSSVDWNLTWTEYAINSPYFWTMFNPIRNLSEEVLTSSGGELSGWVYFIDSLHRIVLAFFIFQTVTAFRKHIK